MADMDDTNWSNQYSEYSGSRSSTPAMPDLYSSTALFGIHGTMSGSSDDQWTTESSYSDPVRFLSKGPFPGRRPDIKCGRCLTLTRENLVLETENNAIKNAYHSLLKAVGSLNQSAGAHPAGGASAGSASSGGSPLALTPQPVLNRLDYPKVLFWHAHEWSAHLASTAGESNVDGPQPRGSSRAAKGINVSMKYVTTADGEVINGYRATDIRTLVNGLFARMGDAGLAPATWMKGSLELQRNFSAEICAQYPEMGLCAEDWKVQYMAKKMYSSWCLSWAGIKLEPDSNIPRRRSAKRGRDDDVGKEDSKRAKSVNVGNKDIAETIAQGSSGVSEDPDNGGQPVAPPVTAPPLLIVNPLLSAAPAPSPAVAAVTPEVAIDVAPAPTAPPTPEINTVVITTVPNIQPASDTVPNIQPAVPTPPKKTRAAKETKAAPSASTTARNLCMKDWCSKHEGGFLSQFKIYWAAIEKTPEGEVWKQALDNAAAAKTQAAI
ncbi:hypothetical protein DFH07DRAFT_956343 [Mycena maculata]|uniref:Uncharacterized protein n=1 Tax=Mycena maculata TaxID=230809 RepID=A0AAD7NJX5_9AGAR|nr:hypothetical protein DFH07DRAFT_956343 [Mycena maculata]